MMISIYPECHSACSRGTMDSTQSRGGCWRGLVSVDEPGSRQRLVFDGFRRAVGVKCALRVDATPKPSRFAPGRRQTALRGGLRPGTPAHYDSYVEQVDR